MRLKGHFLVAVAVIGVASLAALSGAGSAKAGASECPFSQSTSNLCLWQNGSWTGTIWRYWQAKDVSNTWHYVGDNANDQASSLFNDRAHSAYVGEQWVNSGPGSNSACLVPQYSNAHLFDYDWPSGMGTFNDPVWMGDDISSFDLLYSATTCPGGSQPVYNPA